MILSNEDVKIITSHYSPVLKVFHVNFNKPFHFMSLSDNGEIIEWIFDKETKYIKEIEKCNLQRPSDEILSINKHELRKLKKGEYIKITCVTQFDNFIIVGYDDGLILVYQIEKQNLDVKKPVIGAQDKIEEENLEEEEHDNKNKQNNKEKNKIKKKDEEDKIPSSRNQEKKTEEEIINELVLSIDYYNTFSLYYILLGHSQKIRCLYYVPNKKVLVTSSDNCTVKIYDMTNGFSLYHFNLDCIVNKITLIEKKNSQNLILLSEDPYKLIIDITKEPFSFNHYSFKYNNSNQLEKISNGYYLLGPKIVYLFDNNFEYKASFTNLDQVNYALIKIYKDNVILFDNEGFLQITKFQSMEQKKPAPDPKNKKGATKTSKGKNDDKNEEETEKNDQFSINTELKVKIGNDIITDCFIFEQFGFCSSQDNNLYLINLEEKKDLKYERSQMAIEDEISLQMMKNLGNTKSKKKGKGKDGKKKKK